MEWSWAQLILGIWTVASPWVLAFASLRTALWNNIVIGVFVAAIAIISRKAERGIGWWNTAAGVWLAVSPFVLVYYELSRTATWNNIVVGILIVVFSLMNLFRSPPPRAG